MDDTFVETVCARCVHFIVVGNGVKGGYRIEQCYYERDSAEKDARHFTKGVAIESLKGCPDPSKRAKIDKLALLGSK